MSMRHYANVGLILPAEKLNVFLPKEVVESGELNMMFEEEELMEVFRKHLPQHLIPDFIFTADDDIANDQLESGVLYVGWEVNNNPFYSRQLTQTGIDFEGRQILPTMATWVTFG